ncbi:MAG: SMC-Scp complex subunit ScpB [Deltaproteobacteria bacterium]|nr:SMC-Scp complex subunit ScpB [Deltaproteobacteria bacterium]
MDKIKPAIEALIFAADAPLTRERIVAIFDDVDAAVVKNALNELCVENTERGIYLEEVAGGLQFRTKQEYAPWVRKLRGGKPFSFSRAAMETTVIIAYRQPITKSEIDRIRGVDSGGSIKNLLEKKIIRIVGRLDEPGKPILYGTTKKFLEVFSLKDISELPTIQEMQELEMIK